MMRYDADAGTWADEESDRFRAREQAEAATRNRLALRGTVVVLVVCGLAFGTWALGWKDEPQPPAPAEPPPAATATASVTADPQGRPSGSASASASATAPPGYVLATDDEGFTVAVPEGWERRTEGRDLGSDVVVYENDDRSRRLQIFWVEDADPYSSLQLAEKNAERLKGYERAGLQRIGSGDPPAARFEYAYDSKEHGGTRHVVDYRFEAADGQLYAIIGYGPAADGGGKDPETELVETAVASFCPAGADCTATG